MYYEIHRVLLEDSCIPSKNIGDQVVLKRENEWDGNDGKKVQLNFNATNSYIVNWMSLIKYLYVNPL